MNLLPLTIAQAGGGAGGANNFSPIIMMVLLFGIMYFMMIRPQRRREKERKEMINSVKSGNRVLLTSGILAEIITVEENSLVVKIADGVKVKVVRAAISQVLGDGEMPEEIEPK